MKFHPNELVLIYDPHTDLGKKTMAMAKGISNHINDFDYCHSDLTTTIWKEILQRLKMQPKEIMKRSSKYYEDNIKGHEITMQGLLDIITHNPDIIAGPIAIMGKKAVLCKTPTDVLKVH